MSTDVKNDLGLKPDGSCFIIGEVAQTHDGSLGLAHSFIDAIADAGADAVKFQTHIAEAESTPDEPWRVKFSYQDETRYDYWRRMEFTEPQWVGLKAHADERNITFLSTPFSFAAVKLLERVDVPAWKVGSGETNNLPMLRMMAESGKPILLSTGMSSLAEIDRSVNLIKSTGVPVTVMQCTTAYPCPPERVGVNVIPEFRDRFNCPVGLSDHSGTIYPGLAAAVLGANAIEVHVALTREQFGPDVAASITTKELSELVRGVRFIETMMANPVDKDAAVQDMAELRDMFTKSLHAASAMESGHTITADDISVRKPGTGIPAAQFDHILGKQLRRPVEAGHMLEEADIG